MLYPAACVLFIMSGFALCKSCIVLVCVGGGHNSEPSTLSTGSSATAGIWTLELLQGVGHGLQCNAEGHETPTVILIIIT